MYKIEFKNANVSDTGFGLEVNNVCLEETISRALGARVGEGYDYQRGTPFEANSCDITVIISPHSTTSTITVEDQTEELKEYIKEKEEQYGEHSKETPEADTAE